MATAISSVVYVLVAATAFSPSEAEQMRFHLEMEAEANRASRPVRSASA